VAPTSGKLRGLLRRPNSSLGHHVRPTCAWYRLTAKPSESCTAFTHPARFHSHHDAVFSLHELVSAYLQNETPRKSVQTRAADHRRAELWLRVLGRACDPAALTRKTWDRFQDSRASGAIDPRGRDVPFKKRRTVRARTVQADCVWLRGVFAWARGWRTDNGTFLLDCDPLRGLRAPREKNPRRPVATFERYRAVRSVSDDVLMEVRWRGRREPARSYLSEVLDLAQHTGRRLSAICKLRYCDLRLGAGPFGSIRWPAETDKLRRDLVVPVAPEARAAIDRVLAARPGSGPTPLFPSPTDPFRPISRHLADAWLRRAEQQAGLESMEGSLWHAYRRGWATARKHLPDVDVAAAGGWKDAMTLKLVYQQPDADGMLTAVLGRRAEREDAYET
jgi:integrase